MQASSMENLAVDATKAKRTVSAQPMEELKKRDGDGLRGSTKAAVLKTGTREEDRLSLLNIAKFQGYGEDGKIQAPRPNSKPHKPPQGQQLEPTNNHQPKGLARSRTASLLSASLLGGGPWSWSTLRFPTDHLHPLLCAARASPTRFGRSATNGRAPRKRR